VRRLREDLTRIQTVIVGSCLLLVPLQVVAFIGPSHLAPMPLLPLVLAGFGFLPAGILLLPLMHAAFSLPLWSGRWRTIPRVSLGVCAVLAICDAGWLVLGWNDGLARHGLTKNFAMAGWNVAFIATLMLLVIRERAQPRRAQALAFHGVWFAWLSWCAFPYFGELP
jgi:hypothetical protein